MVNRIDEKRLVALLFCTKCTSLQEHLLDKENEAIICLNCSKLSLFKVVGDS